MNKKIIIEKVVGDTFDVHINYAEMIMTIVVSENNLDKAIEYIRFWLSDDMTTVMNIVT